MSELKVNEIRTLDGQLVFTKNADGVVLANSADSVANLATVNKGSPVQVLGFHTKGDGGGGVFFYDAEASKTEHNGGTVIDPNKVSLITNWGANQTAYFTAATSGVGVWKREHSGAVNVKWFGAKGDGVTDDTESIQAAINFSRCIYLPLGVYLVTGLTITNIGQIIKGEKSLRAVSAIKAASSSATIFTVTAPATEWRNLEFLGTSDIVEKGEDVNNIGVFFNRTSPADIDASFESCAFVFLTECVRVLGRNVKFDNCMFSNSKFGINVPSGQGTDVRGIMVADTCRFHSMSKTGGSGACVYINPAANYFEVLIAAKEIDDCQTVFEGFAGHLMIQGVLASKHRGAFCKIDSTGAGLTIARRIVKVDNCALDQASPTIILENGMNFAGPMYLDVSNNIINRCAGHGISTSVNYTKFSGNRIDNAGMYTDSTYSAFVNSGAGCFFESNFVCQNRLEVPVNKMQWGFNITGADCHFGFNVCSNMANKELNLDSTKRIFGWDPRNLPRREVQGVSAPTTGTWFRGDIVWDTTPDAAQKIGWVCTAGGSPGTWKAFGAIDA
jgi:hypothetical protein